MYKIKVSQRALADADKAYAWLEEHVSPAYAIEWYVGLFKELETLKKYPLRCPIVPERDKFTEEFRELVYGKRKRANKYRVFFTIRGDVVVILSIYHSSRNEFEG